MEGFTMRTMVRIGIAAILGTGLLLAQAVQTAEVELKAAQHKAEVEGDLKGAIKQYGAIAARYAKNNRRVAAMALVRMADCYQKVGDAEARKIYEQVLKDYGDQKEAVALARLHLGNSGERGRPTNTLVWSGPKLDVFGAVAHDGRLIAFTDGDTGDLAVHAIATGKDRYLIHTGNPKDGRWQRWADTPVISRDGRQVAYTWWEGRNELYLADLGGDFKPRRLYSNPDFNGVFAMDWSPDDRWLAVSVRREDLTRQIGLISVPDGSLRILKSLDWRPPSRVLFSPDGKYLAYDLPQSDRGSERDVFVLSVDGTRQIRAVAHPSNDLMMGWSPDGKWLLFLSDRSGSMDLWGQALADGKPEGAPERLRANIPVAQEIQPMGATDSGALYYGTARTQDRTKIQVADFDFSTGKLSNVIDISQDYLESIGVPRWSPDGRQLVYKLLRGPTQRPTHEVVVIRSMDNGQTRELRPKLTYFGPMEWSPDGQSFLALGGDLKGRAGIYQIDIETGDVKALRLQNSGERLWYPHWARDGKSFYVMLVDQPARVSAYIQHDISTGKETELIRRKLLEQVKPSPDSRYLNSHSFDEATNSRTMILIPVAGGEVRELMRYPSEVPPEDLTNNGKGVWFNRGNWAPDSRSFLAFKFRDGKYLETWQIFIDGGQPRKLADDLKIGISNSLPAVHPDGRHIAFTLTETSPRRDPEIWALENFLPTKTAKK
jgi:Tol biopolymer transport system component